MTEEQIDKAFKSDIDKLVTEGRITRAGQPERDMERVLSGQFVEVRGGQETPIKLVGDRKATEVVGVLPGNVEVDTATIRTQSKTNFSTQPLTGVDAADLDAAADEILQLARASEF